eukprot:jgi/Chlat1/8653/Chrsp87S08053
MAGGDDASAGSGDRCLFVFKSETTGLDLDRDQIIKLSLVRADVPTAARDWLVRPVDPATGEREHVTNEEFHGVADNLLDAAPTFRELLTCMAALMPNNTNDTTSNITTTIRSNNNHNKKSNSDKQVWPEVAEWVEANTPSGCSVGLVSHYLQFHEAMLRSVANRFGVEIPQEWEFHCTYTMSQEVWPDLGARNYRLNKLCERFNLPVSDTDDGRPDVLSIRALLMEIAKAAGHAELDEGEKEREERLEADAPASERES